MKSSHKLLFGLLGYAVMGTIVWETYWWANRVQKRAIAYNMASTEAKRLNRPLVVIGAPDRGMTGGYPCGDITVDIAGSSCPNTHTLDITQPLPWKDDSVVVFVSYTLEYAANGPEQFDSVMQELNRVSGGHLFVIRVEPWTLASLFYPNAKMKLPSVWHGIAIMGEQ